MKYKWVAVMDARESHACANKRRRISTLRRNAVRELAADSDNTARCDVPQGRQVAEESVNL